MGTTLENLQTAYNGESNASARYAAFAKKAAEEGYQQVAVLFRAASKAEAIHAAEHAGVIQKLGGKPTKDVQTPEVRSTADNLQAAVKGETYERDTMYPGFIAKAKEEGQEDAIQRFDWAVRRRPSTPSCTRQRPLTWPTRRKPRRASGSARCAASPPPIRSWRSAPPARHPARSGSSSSDPSPGAAVSSPRALNVAR
ncbi:MAG: rubrerythrin family protein [Fimbriimonadaceae bacterium]|nr:rubrerythrin family protein [Fimbriimonadaceae bacterium]